MSNKPPAFQFYVKDWLSSARVRMMTYEQVGCYITILCYTWPDGLECSSMADASSMLKHMLGLAEASVLEAVLAHFEIVDGRLVHPKQVEQFKAMASYHTMTEARAKKAAEARWGKSGQPDASSISQALLGDASASASASSSSTVKKNGTVLYGTVASQPKPTEKPETMETMETMESMETIPERREEEIPAEEIETPSTIANELTREWTQTFKLPEGNPADFEMLLRSEGQKPNSSLEESGELWGEIENVMWWMKLISKDLTTKELYWWPRMTSSAVFVRCYPVMKKQYLTFGAEAVNVARKAFEVEEEKKKRPKLTFSLHDDAARTFPVDEEIAAVS